MKPFARRRQCLLAIGVSVVTLMIAGACSDQGQYSPTGMPKYTGTGRTVILIHDAPVDSLQEVWLTVNSVRLIGGGNSGKNQEPLLTEPVRLNLLALDEVSRVLSVSDLDAQTFSKIRLEVSEPEFVTNDGEVIDESQIKLVANGKVDLNFKQPVEVVPEGLTVVSLDMDLENSILVNQTGKGRYILRPQVLVDPATGDPGDDTDSSTTTLEMMDATIIRTNQTLGTLDLELPGSPAILVVYTMPETTYLDAAGGSVGFADLRPAASIVVYGYLDPATNLFMVTEIQLQA
jgi:hypothetical protein